MTWSAWAWLAASLGHSPLGLWLGRSTGRIALLLTLHLVGLTVFLGAVFVSSVQLMGLTPPHAPTTAMARETAGAAAAGLALLLASGLLVFTGGAVEYYATPWFRTKMEALFVALAFHLVVYRSVTRAGAGRVGPWTCRLTGAVTVLLWFGVAFAGRAIAYF